MNPDTLRALLAERMAQPPPLHWFAEVDSTNSEAMRRLRAGDGGPALLLAGAQTAGRGRHGRDWFSGAGSGIYLSLVRPLAGVGQASSLSLVTALVVYETLAGLMPSGASPPSEASPPARLHVKWPNDVLHRRDKIAGILLETNGDSVVFGIGINLDLRDEETARIDQPVTHLRAVLGRMPPPEPIVADLVLRLDGAVETYLAGGFAPFREAWNRADRYYQEDVVVEQNGERLIGRCDGVDEHGALILHTAGGRRAISAGEVFPSLRGNS